jgi:hypothetical protein
MNTMAPGPGSADDGARRAVVWGGLIAGTLDAIYAVVASGSTAPRVFRSVASGLLGKDAFQGGLGTGALGMGLHFFIALTIAAVYVAASRKLPLLVRRAVPCGLLYGMAVYFVMNFVVLPLSAAPFSRPFSLALFKDPRVLGGLFIAHALLIGLPIALVARRYALSAPAAR